MIWTPRTTVAVIVKQNDQYLMVEELIDGKLTLNQPAGHLESNESLIEAAERETLEETAWHVELTSLVGIYRWQHHASETTYIRYCFTAQPKYFDSSLSLDPDIEQAVWLSHNQIMSRKQQVRSPLVLDCLADYISGQYYPLTLLKN